MKVQSTKPQLVAFQITFKQLTQLFFNNKQRNKLKSNQIKSKKLNVKKWGKHRCCCFYAVATNIEKPTNYNWIATYFFSSNYYYLQNVLKTVN